MPKSITLALTLLFSSLTVGVAAVQEVQTEIPAADAKEHVGERATVCGKVANTHYAATSRGRPTFLNFEKPYPDQVFTVVIWGENRPSFPEPPERAYRDKRVCATGTISTYRGAPQISARSPDVLRVVQTESKAPGPKKAWTVVRVIHRKEPSASAEQMQVIPNRAELELDRCLDGWCYVHYKCQWGWLAARHVSERRPVPATVGQSRAAPRTCCKICRKGKACGNSCIARSKTCRKGPGCACNG